MNKRTKSIVDKATSMRGASFALLHYGARPYCASFVRYVFEKTLGKDGDFPIVQLPPYYQKTGIRNPPGKWCADSLAGNEIGDAVPIRNMQPGDLVFYRYTCSGPYPHGSITHVAVCVGSGGIIADARHVAGTIYVGHYTSMNGEVIEVRRPRCLFAGADQPPKEANIMLKNGRAEAILHGRHVKKLEIDLKLNGSSLSVSVDKSLIKHKTVEATIAPTKDLELSWSTAGGSRAVIGQSAGSGGIGNSGANLKVIGHDNRARAIYGGADVRQIQVKVLFENYALHIWVNGKEAKAKDANILVA